MGMGKDAPGNGCYPPKQKRDTQQTGQVDQPIGDWHKDHKVNGGYGKMRGKEQSLTSDPEDCARSDVLKAGLEVRLYAVPAA
jgi:hypothetical protein